MKRALLIGSAAVAMTAIAAPIAAMDVDLAGRIRVEYGKASSDADATLTSNARVDVKASAETCCLNYGGFVRISGSKGLTSTDASVEDDGSNETVDAHIYLSGDWGKIVAGTDQNAKQGAFDTSVVAAGPITQANTGSATVGSDTSITYEAPSMGGIVAKVEFAPDGADTDDSVDWGASLKYSGDMGGFNLTAIAYQDSAENSAFLVSSAMGDLTVAAYTGESETSDYSGLGLKYSMGAASFSAQTGTVGSTDVFILGAGYTLAPGLTASASYGSSDNTTEDGAMKARLQLSF